MEIKKITINNCSSCNNDHIDIEVNPVENPIALFSHIAICPQNKTAIMISSDDSRLKQ